MVGADLAELSKLVARLSGPDRQQLTTTLNEMNTTIQDSADWWVSDYGDKFRRDFASYVTKTQDSLNQVLAQAARVTGQNLSAIATATGNGSGQANTGSGGQLELTADTLSTGTLSTGTLAADGPAGNTAGGSGTAGVRDILELSTAPYAAYFTSVQAWYRSTTVLWRDQTTLNNHAWAVRSTGDPPHAPEFNADSTQEYAKMAYQFLQDAEKNGYKVKVTGGQYPVTRIYDPSTNTFGSYTADGKVKTLFKPNLQNNPNYWDDQPGSPPEPGDLEVVADNAAAEVDANTSLLARLGRFADTPVGRVGGKVMGGLAVAGDLLTIADPSPHALGGPDTERIMAAANLGAMVVTAGPVAGILAANASLDWIPGVGEVVLAATALYFVGDLIYENRQAIGHALSWAGDETAHVASGAYHAATSFVSHTWDDIF
jgi:hypothetical protein